MGVGPEGIPWDGAQPTKREFSRSGTCLAAAKRGGPRHAPENFNDVLTTLKSGRGESIKSNKKKLTKGFILSIFKLIHQESINKQTVIMNNM